MADTDLERARECHGALREIFIHHPGGWADKNALDRVEKLAWQAMTAVNDAECQELLGIVERCAAALYSEAEHHKWRMASLPGADFLRLQILHALDSLCPVIVAGPDRMRLPRALELKPSILGRLHTFGETNRQLGSEGS